MPDNPGGVPDPHERISELEAEVARLRDLADALCTGQELLVAILAPGRRGARRGRGRPVIAEEAQVFRALLKHIGKIEQIGKRRDLTPAIQGAAKELGVSPERINQIVRAAMKKSGLKWR